LLSEEERDELNLIAMLNNSRDRDEMAPKIPPNNALEEDQYVHVNKYSKKSCSI